MACDAEAGVENLYKKIQLPEDWVERLTRELEGEIVERQASAGELRVSLTRRLAALAEELQKLLRAYYANEIPLELLKRDQHRITEAEEKAKSELAATEADLESGTVPRQDSNERDVREPDPAGGPRFALCAPGRIQNERDVAELDPAGGPRFALCAPGRIQNERDEPNPILPVAHAARSVPRGD